MKLYSQSALCNKLNISYSTLHCLRGSQYIDDLFVGNKNNYLPEVNLALFKRLAGERKPKLGLRWRE